MGEPTPGFVELSEEPPKAMQESPPQPDPVSVLEMARKIWGFAGVDRPKRGH